MGGAAGDQAAHAVADQGHSPDLDRPVGKQGFQRHGEVLAVLGDVPAAVVAQKHRRPALLALQLAGIGVAVVPVGVGAPDALVAAQAVQIDRDVAAGLRVLGGEGGAGGEGGPTDNTAAMATYAARNKMSLAQARSGDVVRVLCTGVRALRTHFVARPHRGALDRPAGRFLTAEARDTGGRASAGNVSEETRLMTQGTPLIRSRARASGVIGQVNLGSKALNPGLK